jgi:hypothetical protein
MEATARVNERMPFVFNSKQFLQARKAKGIRPPANDVRPERTDERYCIYDQLSGSYGYTQVLGGVACKGVFDEKRVSQSHGT